MMERSSGLARKKPNRVAQRAATRQALMRRVPRRLTGSGALFLPAVPVLHDHFVQTLAGHFRSFGRELSGPELASLRDILKRKLDQAYGLSPHARVVVTYETDPLPRTSITYNIGVNVSTIADEYDRWVKTRTPPLFGANPDAKVMQLARAFPTPAEAPVLDVGAGTGRNTLPLARLGFPTDALELAPALATVLRHAASAEGLPVRVFEGDLVDPELGLDAAHYRLAILAEVTSHFRSVAQLRAVFAAVAFKLARDGLFVFNVFVARAGYTPDALARQLGEVFWSAFFTRDELAAALDGLSFEVLSDEPTLDYERAHLPPASWPPTGWFVEWASGQNVFDLPPDQCPIELRWLVCRRT